MRSTKLIRAAKAGYILLSVAFCAFGALLAFRPDFSARLLCRIVGVGMVAFGAAKLLGYFSKDLYRLAFQFDLAFGTLLVALGLVILLRPNVALSVLCVILGVETVADGLFKVQTALDARRFGLPTWWVILALALAAGAMGVALAVNPSGSARVLTRLAGLTLLAGGAVNLAVGVCAVKVIEHQQSDALGANMYQ